MTVICNKLLLLLCKLNCEVTKNIISSLLLIHHYTKQYKTSLELLSLTKK